MFFSVKDRNLFHRVDTIGNIFTNCTATSENITAGVHEKACEKSSRWLWKKSSVNYCCEKARKHMCVTGCHDMALAVKVVLNANTTNQPDLNTCIILNDCVGENSP